MNTKYCMVITAALTLFTSVHAKRWTVNKIVARVNGANILLSDLQQPRVDKDAQTSSLKEVVMEQLFVEHAQQKHMVPSSADVERQVVALKIANDISHLTDDQFESQLKEELGLSVDQYKQQLGRVLAVENIKNAEVSEKTFIASQEVEAYFKKNPQYTKERYLIKICSLSKEEAPHYKTLIKNKEVSWKDLGWVNREDIDDHFSHVVSMKPKQVTKPIKSDDKFIILQLLQKETRRKKTLAESYGHIERILRERKQKDILKALEQSLKKRAFITFL